MVPDGHYDDTTGVRDPSKVLLGISSKNVAWKVDENDCLISAKPVYLIHDAVWQYLQKALAGEAGTSMTEQYLIVSSDSGERYFIWREDPALTLRTAKLLGYRNFHLASGDHAVVQRLELAEPAAYIILRHFTAGNLSEYQQAPLRKNPQGRLYVCLHSRKSRGKRREADFLYRYCSKRIYTVFL